MPRHHVPGDAISNVGPEPIPLKMLQWMVAMLAMISLAAWSLEPPFPPGLRTGTSSLGSGTRTGPPGVRCILAPAPTEKEAARKSPLAEGGKGQVGLGPDMTCTADWVGGPLSFRPSQGDRKGMSERNFTSSLGRRQASGANGHSPRPWKFRCNWCYAVETRFLFPKSATDFFRLEWT